MNKKVIEQVEIKLIKQAQKLQQEIDSTIYPFVTHSHPAFNHLQKYMVQRAKRGDFNLIESVNEQVNELTKQRAEVMSQLNYIKRRKDKDE